MNISAQNIVPIEEESEPEPVEARSAIFVRGAPVVKYIIFLVDDLLEVPVLFPAMAPHFEVSRAFPGWKPIAAGFYSKRDGCFGLSDSLQLSSRHQDIDVIRRVM